MVSEKNKDKFEKAFGNLRSALSGLVDADIIFEMPDFSGEEINYATLEVIASEKLMDSLIREASNYFREGYNNARADLRVIEYSDLQDGRFVYSLEMVPKHGLTPYRFRKEEMNDRIEHLLEEDSLDLLHKLPKFLKDLRKKNRS